MSSFQGINCWRLYCVKLPNEHYPWVWFHHLYVHLSLSVFCSSKLRLMECCNLPLCVCVCVVCSLLCVSVSCKYTDGKETCPAGEPFSKRRKLEKEYKSIVSFAEEDQRIRRAERREISEKVGFL